MLQFSLEVYQVHFIFSVLYLKNYHKYSSFAKSLILSFVPITTQDPYTLNDQYHFNLCTISSVISLFFFIMHSIHEFIHYTLF